MNRTQKSGFSPTNSTFGARDSIFLIFLPETHLFEVVFVKLCASISLRVACCIWDPGRRAMQCAEIDDWMLRWAKSILIERFDPKFLGPKVKSIVRQITGDNLGGSLHNLFLVPGSQPQGWFFYLCPGIRILGLTHFQILIRSFLRALFQVSENDEFFPGEKLNN